MIGARIGLRVAPQAIANQQRPAALIHCPGPVATIDEQVIDPATFIADLAQQHAGRILKFDFPTGLTISPRSQSGRYSLAVRCERRVLAIETSRLILTAGAGNDAVRQNLGLQASIMQRRPLHMVMARGRGLPPLFGHCVDGAKTRVTITSATDSEGRTVWQVGGQIAEDGVSMSFEELLMHARREINEALAGFELGPVEWATYRVDRAEHAAGGKRPDDVSIVREQEGHLITVWPTKLALAPRAADEVLRQMEDSAQLNPQTNAEVVERLSDWPRPRVAQPPWETAKQWFADA